MAMNEPIINLPLPLYIMGMNVSVASNTVIAIAPGQCRDSADLLDMPVSFPNYAGTMASPVLNLNYRQPLFVNSAVVGANGLDAGTLAASSSYIIYIIGDSSGFKPVAGLLSLYSNQFPLLPAGYDSYRTIGFVSTDGSTHFTSASVLNEAFAKGFFLQPAIGVTASNATSFTAIDLSGAIPTATDPFVRALLSVTFTPSVAGDTVQFRPTGSTATAGLVTIVGQAAGVAQQQYVYVMTGVSASVPKVDYKVSVSGDSVSISVVGYYVTLS